MHTPLQKFQEAMRNYYKVLEVPEDASAEAIKESYLNLVKRWHPDRNPYNGLSHEMMKMFNEAYEVLSDPQKRSAYDRSIGITPPETNSDHNTGGYRADSYSSGSNANMSAGKPAFDDSSFFETSRRNGLSGYFLSQLSAPAYRGCHLLVGLFLTLIFVPLSLIYQEKFFTPLFIIVLVAIVLSIIYSIVKIIRFILEASKDDQYH